MTISLPPTNPERRPPRAMPARIWGTLALIILIVVVLVQVLRPGQASIPPMFDPGVTLEQARDRARASHKLVLAFATASWCGPCQEFKRNALRDPRVEAWAKQHAETVYIDVDEREKQAQALGVGSIPELIIFKDDHIVARSVGALPANELLEWLGRQSS